jgi:2-oxoglutarate ferredoxin oxidoreductase subunit gamma
MNAMQRTEIRLSGFGGQGIILAAYILGKAAALNDHKHATMTQNYGPESRGGACSGQVIISDAPVSYPHLTRPHIEVVMSQEAYARYSCDLVPGGLLLIDEDLVHRDGNGADSSSQVRVESGERQAAGARLFGIPATRIAEQELGRKMVANIVMLGFLAALDATVSANALRQSVRDSVPKGSEELNLRAFERGYTYGVKLLEEKQKEETA